MRAVAWLVSVGALLAHSMLPSEWRDALLHRLARHRTCSSPNGHVAMGCSGRV